MASKKDFKQPTVEVLAKIATGDYDAVIIGHSQFERIPISAERQKATFENRLMTLKMLSMK